LTRWQPVSDWSRGKGFWKRSSDSRASGTPNDLEDVGADTSHPTFFERLGNWVGTGPTCFCDDFKRGVIDSQFRRDLFVGLALGNQLEHLRLAPTQASPFFFTSPA
jgi:hypothetical protein